MATDYDAPRKTEDDSESIEALKERVPDKLSGAVDVEDADNPSGFELPGADLSDLELDVVVPTLLAIINGMALNDLPARGVPLEKLETLVRATLIGILRPVGKPGVD